MSYNSKTGEIIIEEWETGIGESSAKGFLDMRNCDPFRKPGYLECAVQTQNEADTPFTGTMTAAVSDLITVSGLTGTITRAGAFSGVYKAVTFTSTGTLPAPLVAGTVYFITNNGNLTATTFNISTTLANADAGVVINITDTGTGVHSIASVNMGTPVSIKQTQYNNSFFLQDSNLRIWQKGGISNSFWTLITGNTLTGTANGMEIWKNYLIVFRSTTIDTYSIAGSTWVNSWQSGLTDVGNRYPFSSTDGNLYFYGDLATGTKYYVGSIVEETTFAPGTPATYTFNTQALDLPNPIKGFEDLGSNLVIGTSTNLIHTWDRTSSSYGDPITILEPNVSVMKSFNNILYFSSGVKGNIYRTYGTTPEKFIDLSDELVQVLHYTAIVTQIAFNSNEMIFFVNASFQSLSGIFAADLKTGAYHLKYQLSQGYGITNTAMLAIVGNATSNDNFLIGYSSGSVGFVDTLYPFGVGISPATGYISYVITPLYEVGTFDNPRKMQKAQLILARPLSAATTVLSGGGSIRISSRNNLFDSFTQAVTFDSTNMGTTTIANEDVVNQENCQFIQFKIEIQSAAALPGVTSSVYNTPTIKSIIIK